jgi:hypothetical protein
MCMCEQGAWGSANACACVSWQCCSSQDFHTRYTFSYTIYIHYINIVYEIGVPTYLLPSIFQGASYHRQQHDRQMAAALRTARLASGVVNAAFPIISIISTFSHFRGFTEMY